MDSMKDLIQKRSVKSNRNIHSPAHALADEITATWGEKKLFGRYLGVILRVGVGRARTIFRTIQQDGAKEPGKLFMYLCSKKASERAKKPDADKESKPIA